MRILIGLIVTCGFLGVQDIHALDIDVQSDKIVGKLWRGEEISQAEVVNLLEQVDLQNKQKGKRTVEATVIAECATSLEEISQQRKEDESKCKNIQAFIAHITVQAKNFDPTTIENALGIITDKFL